MKNGFIKVAAATPALRVADPAFNVSEMQKIAHCAAQKGVRVLVFPELCITGYTAGDLFFSEVLTRGARTALNDYLQGTAALDLISVVGLPLVWRDRLYNCAAVCQGENLLGIVPKSCIPNHGACCEARYFTPAPTDSSATMTWDGKEIPFGADLTFACTELPSLTLAVRIGENNAVTASHATLLCNPTASPETVGADTYRRTMLGAQSAGSPNALVSASAGTGESTTDLVFGGHCLIYENGTLLAEKLPFDNTSEILITEIDVERLVYERRRANTFAGIDTAHREIAFSLPVAETVLTRLIDPHPFIPADPTERARRCEKILSIQSTGLKGRVERAFAKKLVLGISGGLDSTLALLVMVRAMDQLGRPRKDILAVTMPCFGTTKRNKNNATVLCEELGVDFRCVDIFDAGNIHYRDIGHDPNDRNVTYENSQARERTQILMDIANDCGGMVIGTGDLSELALGWATYNGDHMSMYGVNASIPKTLVRHLVAHCADEYEANGNAKIAAALRDVLNTPVSPELLPANENGEIAQKTEDLVGPYELHDFYLFYMLRYGFSPEKLYRMAKLALGNVYDNETLRKWLKIFVRRFFNQQFKRSCMPDGPKVGSVGLSPRGDWHMPSDASSALWLAEAESL